MKGCEPVPIGGVGTRPGAKQELSNPKIVDVRGLATAYSGHLSPEELIATGRALGEEVRDHAG